MDRRLRGGTVVPVMPHLRFRGCDEALLERLTPALVSRLAGEIMCEPDWITVECVATRYLTTPPVAFVEILWFDRGAAVKDRVAAALAEAFSAHGVSVPTIRFVPIHPGDYYEDGRHF